MSSYCVFKKEKSHETTRKEHETIFYVILEEEKVFLLTQNSEAINKNTDVVDCINI